MSGAAEAYVLKNLLLSPITCDMIQHFIYISFNHDWVAIKIFAMWFATCITWRCNN